MQKFSNRPTLYDVSKRFFCSILFRVQLACLDHPLHPRTSLVFLGYFYFHLFLTFYFMYLLENCIWQLSIFQSVCQRKKNFCDPSYIQVILPGLT